MITSSDRNFVTFKADNVLPVKNAGHDAVCRFFNAEPKKIYFFRKKDYIFLLFLRTAQ